MFVAIGPDSIALEEPDDFGRFHVTLIGVDAAAADALLQGAGAGSVSGDAFIAVWAVRLWAGRDSDAEWMAGFEKMLAYAASKGWLGADGAVIQAHVENA